jgi:hypothetical protein
MPCDVWFSGALLLKGLPQWLSNPLSSAALLILQAIFCSFCCTIYSQVAGICLVVVIIVLHGLAGAGPG